MITAVARNPRSRAPTVVNRFELPQRRAAEITGDQPSTRAPIHELE